MTATGFRMLGVRKSGFGIVAVRGDIRTPASGKTLVALEIRHEMPPISDCCSGAPVWDGGANTVIGMATVPDRRTVTRTAYMIPIQDVLRVVGSVRTSYADMGEFYAAPDSAGEPVVGVYGLRTFTIDHGKLRPVFERRDSSAWRDGTCIAECSKGARHQAPADDCTCGVYSFRDLNHLRRQYSESATIVGVIALEGRVVEGESGWRAQAARLIALWEQEPGVVDVLPGVERYRQVDDMVRAYPGLTVGSSSERAGAGHVSPRPVPLWTSLSGPAPRPVLPKPVAASPTPLRYQRSARRAAAGVLEFSIPLLVAGVPLVILAFAHGLVVVLIEIFVMLVVMVATALVS
ncbi:hypothetical protein ACFZC5_31615 [Nocardia gamkensis]|uniref:hypothetical protein n=1 Tax=Nocardia gamkensis TaxID=352869 RepID=UPI0036EB01A3